MNNNAFTGAIKKIVTDTDKSAKVILFGSRATGQARKDSDWDILILLNKPNVTMKDGQIFRHKLYELELQTGEAISTFVYSQLEWENKYSITPLYSNIQKEGITL
jgi:uncharacterized protein